MLCGGDVPLYIHHWIVEVPSDTPACSHWTRLERFDLSDPFQPGVSFCGLLPLLLCATAPSTGHIVERSIFEDLPTLANRSIVVRYTLPTALLDSSGLAKEVDVFNTPTMVKLLLRRDVNFSFVAASEVQLEKLAVLWRESTMGQMLGEGTLLLKGERAR